MHSVSLTIQTHFLPLQFEGIFSDTVLIALCNFSAALLLPILPALTTFNTIVAFCPFYVTVIFVLPIFLAVRYPVLLTDATDGLLEEYEAFSMDAV